MSPLDTPSRTETTRPTPPIGTSGTSAEAAGRRSELELSIEGMTCVACAARIEKVLGRLPAVTATVNFATERARVVFDPAQIDADRITDAVSRAGYGAHRVDDTPQAEHEAEALAAAHHRSAGRALLISALLTLPLVAQMAGMFAGRHDWMLPGGVQLVLATIVQFWFGRHFYRGAWNALRGGGANMDVLVVLGTTMAWAYSTVVVFIDPTAHVYFESSAAIITLVLFGKWLEARARSRTGAAIAALISLQPPTARVERRREDGSIETFDRPVADVRPGDTLQLRPGESFPVDGEVLEGRSSANESMLTGESLPVHKVSGDPVYAGTANGTGALRVRATGVGSSTALARIVRLVSEAQGSKAPIQRLADRISGIFVPIVLVLAILTFATWMLLGAEFSQALVPAIAVLIIACPCALGLATPTAVIVGIGEGSRAGILIRNASALEAAHRLNTMIVDKTGTLTTGTPAVVAIAPFDGATAGDVLALAAALEANSEHPLAQAVRTAATADAHPLATHPIGSVEGFEAVVGSGVRAQVDGAQALLGAPEWLVAQGIVLPERSTWLPAAGARQAPTAATAQDPAGEAMSWVVVARAGRALGAIALADALRADTVPAVRRLREAGIEVIMMSGDDASVSARIAAQAGIARHHGRCQPQDKAAEIGRLKAQGRHVGMVGDGINDAPALAAAEVSFAIGSGSGVALHTADITLMGNRLSQVVDAIALSRATMAKIRQNLFFAFIYNVLGIPLAAAGMLDPIIAGGAMAASSVCVVSNALLLRRWRPQPADAGGAATADAERAAAGAAEAAAAAGFTPGSTSGSTVASSAAARAVQ